MVLSFFSLFSYLFSYVLSAEGYSMRRRRGRRVINWHFLYVGLEIMLLIKDGSEGERSEGRQEAQDDTK